MRLLIGTLGAASVLAVALIALDRRHMPTIEYFRRDHALDVVGIGAYVVGLGAIVAGMGRRVWGRLRRRSVTSAAA